LNSRSPLKTRKLYTTQSPQSTRSARSTPPSHTTSHTARGSKRRICCKFLCVRRLAPTARFLLVRPRNSDKVTPAQAAPTTLKCQPTRLLAACSISANIRGRERYRLETAPAASPSECLPITRHNAVWKTDRNPPLTGHFPDRRRPDRSGLDTSHKAVSGYCANQ